MGRFNATAFSDVPRMHYKDFMRVVKVSKPYRGTDAYPVGERRYSHRHFVIRDGKVQVWHSHLRSADEWRKGNSAPNRRWAKDRHLITVHPDNTVEFHNLMGIGDCMFLRGIIGGHVFYHSKRGGAVWQRTHEVTGKETAHPLFKGLRVSLNDHSVHPDSQYKMIYRRVIPKVKKQIMGELDGHLTAGMAMLSSMTLEGVKEMWKELRQAGGKHKRDELLKVAIQNNHCLDVIAHMCLEQNSAYRIDYADNMNDVKVLISSLIKKSSHIYLSAHQEAFKTIEREPFDFPTASWGIQIKAGDKFVERL